MKHTKTSLPGHGWIGCNRCIPESENQLLLGSGSPPEFKIEKPNASWGSSNPLIVVLGFSRGTNQKTTLPFDEIAFAGMRPQLTKILQKLGLMEGSNFVGNRINSQESIYHFGSLFRCSVSMWDKNKKSYSKSGGGILEKFVKAKENQDVANNCIEQHLGKLPETTRLVLMLGNSGKYVDQCEKLVSGVHPGIQRINEVSYGNEKVTWVHTIHAKAQGSYLPQWLEGRDTAIGKKLKPAINAVKLSGVLGHLTNKDMSRASRDLSRC